MNYAIVQASGRQFLIKPGKWYDLDLIKKTNLGDFIILNKILLIKNENKLQFGQPFLNFCGLPAKIIQKVKGKKIIILKTKPKKKYTRVQGHRQGYTRIQINSLN